jgi:hypothetical protein
VWAYSWSNCPDRPSPEELSVLEVEAQICKVLDFAVIKPLVSAPTSYKEGSLVSWLVLHVRFLQLSRFYLFNVFVFLHSVSRVVTMSRRMPICYECLNAGGDTCLQQGHEGT